MPERTANEPQEGWMEMQVNLQGTSVPQRGERLAKAPFGDRGQGEVRLSISRWDCALERTVSFSVYVEKIFAPDHVMRKTPAGRVHYHAILKHVLNPDVVDRIFSPASGCVKGRLKPVPDWPYLDDVRLCDLSAAHIHHLIVSAAARGYSPQTIKHIRNVVGAVISHARKNEVFTGDNPASVVELPPMTRRASRDLTIAEARAILSHLRYPEREIALMSITTGIGISEICHLRWRHVNLSNRQILCDGEVIPPQCILVSRCGTYGDAIDPSLTHPRKLDFPNSLIRWLLDLRRKQGKYDPDRFIVSLPGEDGLSPIAVQMLRLKPVGRALGIPWLSWQVLKRAHNALLSELTNHLSDQLVLSTRKNPDGLSHGI
jgi:hypothetical protein